MEKKHILHNPDGSETSVYPLDAFKRETMAYGYDRHYKQALNLHWSAGLAPDEAIAAIRRDLGAMTRQEKAEHRILQLTRGAGRPRLDLSVAEAKAAIAAAFFKTLTNLEKRQMTLEARQLLDGMKKQLAAW